MAGEKIVDVRLHLERHKVLHEALDELVADWITANEGLPSQNTIMDLMQWSAREIKRLEVEAETKTTTEERDGTEIE